MNQESEEPTGAQLYTNLVVLWTALFLSQFIFLLVIYFVEPTVFDFDYSKPLLDKNSMIIVIFAGAAVLNLGLSFLLRKKFIDQSVTDQNIFLVQTAMIVGCALCEVVSLFGVMLAFVAAYQYFFLWVVLGAAGMIFHFPLRKNIMNASFGKRNIV